MGIKKWSSGVMGERLGVVECWSNGVMGIKNGVMGIKNGVMEYWSIGGVVGIKNGVMKYWSNGVMEYWSNEKEQKQRVPEANSMERCY
jgi:hypothetical protein